MEVFNHRARKVGSLVQRRIEALGIGQKMQDLPEDLWHKSFRHYVKENPTRKGGSNTRLIRLNLNTPPMAVPISHSTLPLFPYIDDKKERRNINLLPINKITEGNFKL